MLVTQIYSPFDMPIRGAKAGSPSAVATSKSPLSKSYPRVVYIFGCNDSSCNNGPGTFVVLQQCAKEPSDSNTVDSISETNDDVDQELDTAGEDDDLENIEEVTDNSKIEHIIKDVTSAPDTSLNIQDNESDDEDPNNSLANMIQQADQNVDEILKRMSLVESSDDEEDDDDDDGEYEHEKEEENVIEDVKKPIHSNSIVIKKEPTKAGLFDLNMDFSDDDEDEKEEDKSEAKVVDIKVESTTTNTTTPALTTTTAKGKGTTALFPTFAFDVASFSSDDDTLPEIHDTYDKLRSTIVNHDSKPIEEKHAMTTTVSKPKAKKATKKAIFKPKGTCLRLVNILILICILVHFSK